MISKPLCIIPARGNSKRFPRKNLALLAGKPLLVYAIESALESEVFHQVCVSSEDEEVLEVALLSGAHVALKRPESLSSDTAQVKHVCLYLLEQFAAQDQPYEEFGLLLPTSPFRTGEDIKKAYELFRAQEANYLMSLVPYSHPPQRAVWCPYGYVQPYFGIDQMKQAQQVETLYRHDGAIILARVEAFRKEQQFYGSKVVPYFMPVEKSVDIDSPLDLAWAEFLLSRAPGLLAGQGRERE